ncbi:MAG: DUF4167 domain-containing protein [Rhizomicrobium sp.]
MKSTRRPQKAFTTGQRPRDDKQRPATNFQRSDNDQEHWKRRQQHYLSLAEGAGGADRVDRENYWQHAEHFHRLIAAAAESRRQASADVPGPPTP